MVKGGLRRIVRNGLVTVAFIGLMKLLSSCDLYEPIPSYKPIPTEQTTEPTTEPTAEPTSAPTAEPDYVNVSGGLENNVTNMGEQGVITVRNPADNSILKQVSTLSDGTYSFALDRLVSELPNGIIIEAYSGTSANPTSYTRRIINLPAGDVTSETDPRMNPAIRVTKYESDFDHDCYYDLDKNRNGVIDPQEKEDFKTQFGRMNTESEYVLGNTNHGLKKWNNLQGFVIDPNFSSWAGTTEEIISAINYDNYSLTGQIPIEVGTEHLDQPGYISIHATEYGDGPYAFVYDNKLMDGYLDKARIYLNCTVRGLVDHEAIGHGLLFSGHSSEEGIPELYPSDMVWSGLPADGFTATDTKASYIVSEPTYLGMEQLDDLLGSN